MSKNIQISRVKMLISSYPSVLINGFGAQKNCLIEMVLLSTQNIFWLRNKKINF